MSMAGTPFRSRLRAYWQLGAPDETPARWRKLSPVFNLARIEAPVLMQLPEQEYIHSLDYAAPLLKQHRADLYVFPNEPHLPFQPRHMVAMYERNLDWFRFWLQGVEDPAPSKSAQYSHWREIRSAESKGAAH
jgi:dipeptidyl aminopeptidase/acylaminoacyl peptidase